MLITVIDSEPPDIFTKTTEFAYKDNKIYDIYESSKSYTVGMCLGRVKVIVDDDNNVLKFIYPLMSGGDYEILNNEKIEHYKNIINAFNKTQWIL